MGAIACERVCVRVCVYVCVCVCVCACCPRTQEDGLRLCWSLQLEIVDPSVRCSWDTWCGVMV